MMRFLRQNNCVIDLACVTRIDCPYMSCGNTSASLYHECGQVFAVGLYHRLPPVPKSEAAATDWTAWNKRAEADVQQQFDALVDRWMAARSPLPAAPPSAGETT